MFTVEQAEAAKQKQQEAASRGEREPPEEDEEEIAWDDSNSDKENKYLLPIGRPRPS
jgi:hypothetical protein